LKEQAQLILNKALKNIDWLKSPRAVAFAIIGLYFINKNKPDEQTVNSLKNFADHLCELYQNQAMAEWQWFEPYLTYSNSKLSEALYYAYLATKNKKYLSLAETSLNFLMSIYFTNGSFTPIGQNGWYYKKGKRAYFDQQPEDAGSMVETLVVAYQATKKELYKTKAHRAFKWFLGHNDLQQMMYNEITGGCRDGLGKNSLNLNEGAESTIAYLLARLTLEKL
ncbi:MAG: hypothetical protein V1684_01425, partial [bacterium]